MPILTAIVLASWAWSGAPIHGGWLVLTVLLDVWAVEMVAQLRDATEGRADDEA